MGDPRNPARKLERWNTDRVFAMETYIRLVFMPKELEAAISGGWAWHLMSPKHTEYKMLHDHKDVDVIVAKRTAQQAIQRLKDYHFERVKSQYDRNNFQRYERHVSAGNSVAAKIQIDLFIEDVPKVECNGLWIVEPKTLLSFYDKKQHTTDDCIAVKAARELLKQGISPIGRNELIKFP